MVGVRFSYLGSLFYVELVPRDLFPYLVLYTRFRVEIKKNSSYRHLDLVYCVPSLVFGIHDNWRRGWDSFDQAQAVNRSGLYKSRPKGIDTTGNAGRGTER